MIDNSWARRVLFLDDDETRIERAKKSLSSWDLSIARTVDEAIELLKGERFGTVRLDHDLGGTQMSPSDEKSGAEVARFIVSMPIGDRPPLVILHSFNPTGSQRMLDILFRNVQHVKREPFNL